MAQKATLYFKLPKICFHPFLILNSHTQYLGPAPSPLKQLKAQEGGGVLRKLFFEAADSAGNENSRTLTSGIGEEPTVNPAPMLFGVGENDKVGNMTMQKGDEATEKDISGIELDGEGSQQVTVELGDHRVPLGSGAKLLVVSSIEKEPKVGVHTGPYRGTANGFRRKCARSLGEGYMAPECYGGLITFKSDIYSLGIVIIEILTGQKGYPEIENVLQSWTARFGTSQGDRRLEPVRICAEIGIECTEFNPTKRPVTQHIIERLAEMECTYGFIKSDLFISPSESTGSDEVKLEEGGNFFANDKPEMEDNKFDKGTGPKRFIYGELATATANFSDEHKIGESGFGSVYRGFLNEPPLAVAIKRVSKSSKQGRKEYTSEMLIVSRLRHRNIARLIGCCEDGGELLLVYELMPNGSLDEHLHSANASPMSWPHRHKVVMGLGSALLYLHEEWEQCLVHGNITPSNVMLDASFNAKLGDFRLARLVDHGRGSYSTDLWRHHYDRLTRRSQGDLSCLINRSFTTDSDVHSFGVVLLEIACGMYPLEYTEREDPVNFVDWVWEHYEKGTILDAADARLNGEFDVKEMETVMIVGLCCAHPDRSLIPSIRQAVNVLRSEAPLPSLPPWKPSIRQTVSVQWSSEHPLRSLPPSMPSMRQAVNVLRSEAPLPSLPPWMPVEVSSSSTPTQPSLSPPALQGQPPGLNDTGCTIV
ncbi:hypothetical protein PR202_ga11912 [Eleusine coracana subsp. coracana]|uniref:Protein kinase domain-containing protein n=1 Tax=Eleusine coracana subsp. coracana TaxID=191504 RepID=A0AAV5CA89_ELECO|nr:hypothetical protein PR202_ga11912 [Eleusine coracana subsp. coracana]